MDPVAPDRMLGKILITMGFPALILGLYLALAPFLEEEGPPVWLTGIGAVVMIMGIGLTVLGFRRLFDPPDAGTTIRPRKRSRR